MAAASADTINACLTLALDVELDEFWETVPKGDSVTAPYRPQGRILLAVRGGLRAVLSLRDAVTPDVSTEVATAIWGAVSAARDMNETLKSTGMFDTREMTAALSPVVQACMDAGVDMTTG